MTALTIWLTFRPRREKTPVVQAARIVLSSIVGKILRKS
jgi:hypothetical protein